MDLSSNHFSSTISPSIAKLTRMQTLILSQTLLTGSLPNSMMQLINMSKSQATIVDVGFVLLTKFVTDSILGVVVVLEEFVAYAGLFDAPALDFALSWPKLGMFLLLLCLWLPCNI
jgi:hypothetical protein